MLRTIAKTPLRNLTPIRYLSHTRMTMNTLDSDVPANQRTDGPAFTSMRGLLLQQFQSPSTVSIYNDSYKHAGHHGIGDSSNKTESHVRLEIVSSEFTGLNLPKRHRLIYKLLGDDMKKYDVHALQLSTKTPEEFEKAQARNAD